MLFYIQHYEDIKKLLRHYHLRVGRLGLCVAFEMNLLENIYKLTNVLTLTIYLFQQTTFSVEGITFQNI